MLLEFKDDEKNSQGAKCQKGCPKSFFIIISRSPAPKPDLMPASRLCYDIDRYSIKVCGKSHKG